jgi:diacylglycerol kinase family enzyme
MATASPLTVIVNASAGSASNARTDIERALRRHRCEATIALVNGGEIRAEAERAAARGHTLVAAGGDGTVSTIAAVAIAARRRFGVIPLGTLNHFARDAGIPSDIDAAVDVIVAGRAVPLDVGLVNGRPFLNNVSLGFYVRIVRERREEQRRGRRKWIGFAIGMARAWLDYRPITVRLTVDGADLIRRTPFVFVGNGPYEAEGLDIGRRCSIDALQNAELSIWIAPDAGRLELLRLSVRALAGRLASDIKFESFRAGRALVETALRHPTAALDGELVPMSGSIEFAVQKAALEALLPDRPRP